MQKEVFSLKEVPVEIDAEKALLLQKSKNADKEGEEANIYSERGAITANLEASYDIPKTRDRRTGNPAVSDGESSHENGKGSKGKTTISQ